MSLNYQSFNERWGFTLIETILVAGIISIGLLTTARLFPFGLRAKKSAEQYSIASLLGQQIMEEIKEKGYDALSTLYPSNSLNYGLKEGDFEEYKEYKWRVEWWDTEIPNLRRVRVRILGKEDRRLYFDLTTYLAKRD